jgi:hypothetical protein
MSNARLKWLLPTVRVGGEALPVAEIAFVEILMSADGGNNFSGLTQAIPTVLEHVVNDLAPGTYAFRAIVQDTDGRRSAENNIQADVGDGGLPPVVSAPAAVPEFTVTIE